MRTITICLTAAALVATGAVTPAAATVLAPKAVTSPNLVANGTAEAGAGSTDGSVVPVPKWTAAGGFTAVQYGAGGGFPTPTDPGPVNRGANFFAGGPDQVVSTGTEVRGVAVYKDAIDAGTATYKLQGYLGGFSAQEDNAVVTVDWTTATGTVLGTASIGPVTATDRGSLTGLKLRKTSGAVPPRARKAVVTVTLTREAGSYDDGYADNIALTITTP